MHLPKIAKRIFPDWNLRIFSPDEAEQYCRTKNLQVREVDDDVADYGLYTVYRNVEWILINKRLDPVYRQWVFGHEIFHSAAHAPETSYFSPSMEDKNDFEANFFIAVSMMPKPYLIHTSVDELCYHYNIPRALVTIRKTIADNYNI